MDNENTKINESEQDAVPQLAEEDSVPKENTIVRENPEDDKTENENPEDKNPENGENEETDNAKSENESKEFISDFAPEPIKIPNYNSEKEHKKRKKEKEKDQKKLSQRSKKTRRVVRKILFVVRCLFMFVLLFAVVTATLGSLLVRVNTSEYAVENSIKNNHPEKFVIGKIKGASELNLKKSSPRASIADILRDNARGVTTYDDIVQAVNKSSYAEFIAKQAHGVISALLFGDKYSGILGRDVSKALRANIAYIKLVTEIELGESACDDFGNYVDASKAFDEIKPDALAKLSVARYTGLTEVGFSLMVLICLAVALMLLMVITAAICSGKAHTVIGWSCMLSGICISVAGYLFNPAFTVKSEFVMDVYGALLKSFHQSSLVYGGVVAALGLLILLIGHAIADSYDEESIEE